MLNEFDCFFGQVICEICFIWNIGIYQRRNGPWTKVTTMPWRTLMCTTYIDVKTMILRKVAVTAKMPFTYVPCLIAT